MNAQEYEELEYTYNKQMLEESIDTYNKLAEQASFHTVLIVGVVSVVAYGVYHFFTVENWLMVVVLGIISLIGLTQLLAKTKEESMYNSAAQQASVQLQTLISNKTQADIKKKIMEYEQEEMPNV